MPNKTSRSRYEDYLQDVQTRRQKEKDEKGDGDKKSSQRSFWQLLGAFWHELRDHRGKVILALATLTVATLLGLLPPAGTKFAIDYVLTSPPQPTPAWVDSILPADLTRMGLLWYIAGTVVVITIVRTAVHLWGRWQATKAVNMVQADIRRRVYEHALELPLHRIQDLKSGGTTSLIREDAGGVADLVFNMLYNPWAAIIQLLGSLAVLVMVDWRLMVGGLMLLPAVWITHRTWIRRVRPLYKDIRSRRQQIDASTTETFGGIRIVRTFARSKSESGRFTRGTHLLARQQLMVWWSTRIIEVIWDVLIPLASTGLLLYGGWQILNADLTLGDLMMFLVYLTMLLGPIASIASSAMSFQNNLAGLDRVLDLLAEQTESSLDQHKRSFEKETTQGAIEFENVSFKYPNSQRDVLCDISFGAPAGTTIALVGRSGAGKTTLCNLVARFYNPSTGKILVDGVDISESDLNSYRKLLGVVEQDVFMFDGTVRDNIAYGRRGATDDEIHEAAQAAAAHEFILELADGYNTWIGERGVKLSGGQRQRLAIARAILADPRILILDEATSNLDSESEQLIQHSLSRLLKGRTAFVIAHRLSTIKHADMILVMDAGRVVEQGTHAELVEKGGIYGRMVLLQIEAPVASDSGSNGDEAKNSVAAFDHP